MAEHRAEERETDSTSSRRSFLGAGLLGGAVAAAAPLLAWQASGGEAPRPAGEAGSAAGPAGGHGGTAAPSAAAAADSTAAFELEEATIADLQAAMAAGRQSSRRLVEAYLARIAALDRQGPRLRAVLEVNPEALATAEALDAERRAKGPRGPLHGIPILIKDNIDTHDRMTTTAGSLALAGSVPARDAFIVERLRAAGAVLLGKANLSEWANFRSNRSTSGWSGRGGQCRNPYALDRSPSGSSSGSAAAAAANLCVAAIGTETDGSIVSPAGHCGLVGIKPTVGLASRSGIVPISHTQDTPGPMARTVADAALLLGAIAGLDAADPATVAIRKAGRGREPQDYTQHLRADGLKGARLGVARKAYFGRSAADPLIEEALAEMRRQGAEIVDPIDIPTAAKLGDNELQVLLYEFKADLNRYLAARTAPVRNLAELIAWNERHRDQELPFFGQELFVQAEAKGPLTDAAYRKALAANHLLSRRQGIDAVLAKHQLDAIVAPTGGPSWLIDLPNGDAPSGGSSRLAAVAGYPSITVPAGYLYGLPVGISFFGAAWSEPTLLRIAYAFEQATRHRQPPRFRATAELPPAAVGGALG
jgi:amidase